MQRPWAIANVTQGSARISFCFPWTLREIASTPAASTSDALPPLLLDWRGAVIYERLRALGPQPTQGVHA